MVLLMSFITPTGRAMIDVGLLGSVVASIVLLLVLILVVRLPAFISLLISSIFVGIMAGMNPVAIMDSVKAGMGGTLGSVATLVGLGAMFGAILEYSGGAQSIAQQVLRWTGDRFAQWALLVIGFLIAVPVFFDVALIIIIPIVYALQRKSGKSLLYYAIPLLIGLAITHVCIPPTPGPIAVAEIIKADLGLVIIAGISVGLPTAVICGPMMGTLLAKHMHIDAPSLSSSSQEHSVAEAYSPALPSFWMIALIIVLPIVLIVTQTFMTFARGDDPIKYWYEYFISIAGHPFAALIIANIVAWITLGLMRGVRSKQLLRISNKSFELAGIIILLTGAGGVYKQMLIETKAGEMIATFFQSAGVSTLLFAFVAAALIRILQGSATVAMITGAGLASAAIAQAGLTDWQLALHVMAIACGATTLSHVNDSGFWLVSKYLGLDTGQTIKAWTSSTGLISLVGFLVVLLYYSLS